MPHFKPILDELRVTALPYTVMNWWKAFAAEKAANEARIAAAAPVVEEATEDTAEETTEASNEEE